MKLYYLQYQGSEFGPMPLKELQSVVRGGKIKGAFHIWSEGMGNWCPIRTTADVTRIVTAASDFAMAGLEKKKEADLVLLSGRERRSANRWPIVATVALIQAAKSTVIGLCRDVSRVGTSLVLEMNVGLQAGMTLDFQIQPVRVSGLLPFTFKGRVTWVNPKDFTAGILFAQITKTDATALAKYLDASERRSLKF